MLVLGRLYKFFHLSNFRQQLLRMAGFSAVSQVGFLGKLKMLGWNKNAEKHLAQKNISLGLNRTNILEIMYQYPCHPCKQYLDLHFCYSVVRVVRYALHGLSGIWCCFGIKGKPSQNHDQKQFRCRLLCGTINAWNQEEHTEIGGKLPDIFKQFNKLLLKATNDWKITILLMEEILHQLIGSLSHYLQGFIHPRWCRISSTNSINGDKSSDAFPTHLWKPLFFDPFLSFQGRYI